MLSEGCLTCQVCHLRCALVGQVHPQDPPAAEALRAADEAAALARALVEAILATPALGERLGQHVRNLDFECLGLPEEGAELGTDCSRGCPPSS